MHLVSAARSVVRSDFLSAPRIARFTAALLATLLLPFAATAFPVTPSAGCVPSPYTSGDLTCTNTGAVTVTSGANGIDAPATGGNATTTNFGTVSVSGGGSGIVTTTDTGNAATTNLGSVSTSGSGAFGIDTETLAGNATATNLSAVTLTGGGIGIQTVANNGNALTINFGSINVSGTSSGCLVIHGFGACGIFSSTNYGILTQAGIGNATTTNVGTINVSGGFGTVGIYTNAVPPPATQFGAVPSSGGDATTTNVGNVTVTGNNASLFTTIPSEPTANIASNNTVGIWTQANIGNATTINGGNVNVTGPGATGIRTATNTGNATTINSGNVNVVGTPLALPGVSFGSVAASAIGISTIALNGNAVVVNSGTVSAQGPNNIAIYIQSSANSVLVNSGTISAPGSTAIQFVFTPTDPATLTLQPGSFIIGAINMIGAGDTINVNAGNQNLTFNTLAGITVNGTVPFVVSGNRMVSIDPTGFAVADRGLMDFTHAISGTLGGRVNDAASNATATGGRALGFAGYDDSVSRFDDAFSEVMGYAKAPSDAVLFKNPTMTAPDGTTVWARGFYGQRTQQADGPVLRNVSSFYGGAIGADKLTRPDLRLGGFVGGGAINTTIDFNSGNAKSDIGFAGLYGRKDFGAAFVDFALLGGLTSNNTTRNINNNTLANGLEIATASFSGWFLSPEIAAGYRYEFLPGWAVTPAARLRYLAAGYDGFTESGSTANLTAAGRTLQNAEERGDVTLTRTQQTDIGRIQLGLTAGVLGQQRTGSGTVNAILLGQALAFATPGKSSIAGGYAGVSFDWRTRSGVALFAAAEYTAMTDSSNTVTGKAGLRYGF
jgi:uncharacterized protein with beta-barrel porin domain